jgi:hypothetical protein
VPAAPTAAMGPTTHPFGPVQQRELQQAGATLAKLTRKRLQLVGDHKTCSDRADDSRVAGKGRIHPP